MAEIPVSEIFVESPDMMAAYFTFGSVLGVDNEELDQLMEQFRCELDLAGVQLYGELGTVALVMKRPAQLPERHPLDVATAVARRMFVQLILLADEELMGCGVEVPTLQLFAAFDAHGNDVDPDKATHGYRRLTLPIFPRGAAVARNVCSGLGTTLRITTARAAPPQLRFDFQGFNT